VGSLLTGLTLLFVALQGEFGAAQALPNLFGRIGRGGMAQMLMHFMEVLVLLNDRLGLVRQCGDVSGHNILSFEKV
jgi:hypothetical protein